MLLFEGEKEKRKDQAHERIPSKTKPNQKQIKTNSKSTGERERERKEEEVEQNRSGGESSGWRLVIVRGGVHGIDGVAVAAGEEIGRTGWGTESALLVRFLVSPGVGNRADQLLVARPGDLTRKNKKKRGEEREEV